MDKQRLSAPAARKWTNADDYIEGLIRLRRNRTARGKPVVRTEPETPRLLLSTVPFGALLAALGVLSVAIMIAAWPVHEVSVTKQEAAQLERGVAPRGWFQEAQKDMHR